MKNLSRRTRLLLASLGAAAVLAAVTVFAVSSVHRQDQAVPGLNPAAFSLAPTVPALAAADSDTVVLAPYSADWWKKIAAMAPAQTGLLQLDPGKAGAPVLRLGYTRGPDHAKHDIPYTGPLRLVYLEAATAGDAETIATWLKNEPRYDSRRVHVQDRTVIVGQSWDAAFAAPEKTMRSVSAYQPGDATAQGSMWMNVDQEVISLAGGADTKNGKLYSEVLSKGIGFKPGTTWTGFSDNGDTWKGDFRSGGIDKNQISFQDTQSDLTATEKVLYESKSGATTTKLIDPGAGSLMAGTSISAKGTTMGAPVADPFPKVDDQIVSMVNDVSSWTTAATGNYSGPESIGQRTLSANATSMVLSFSYGPVGVAPGAGDGHAPFGSAADLPKK
jgi:hypothetical protein